MTTNEGKRFNKVNTLCRVHGPEKDVNKSIQIHDAVNEVILENNKEYSWFLDDTIPFNSVDKEENDVLKNNNIVFNKFLEWYNSRINKNNKNNNKDYKEGGHLACLLVGGSGSGKSYTLFGPPDNPGILPRFCDYIFSSDYSKITGHLSISNVCLQCFLMEGEEMIDLFQPFNGRLDGLLKISNTNNNLGPIISDLTHMICMDLNEIRVYLSMAIKSASIIMTHSGPYYTSNFCCRLVLTSGQIGKKNSIINSINFIEMESFNGPDISPIVDDRLSGSSLKNISTRLMRDAGKKFFKKDSNKISNTLSDVQVERSFLTYYLKDSLFKKSDCYLIGCCRAIQNGLEDNYRTLDWLNRMDILSNDENEPYQPMSINDILINLNEEENEAYVLKNKFMNRKEKWDEKVLRYNNKMELLLKRGETILPPPPIYDFDKIHTNDINGKHTYEDLRDSEFVYDNKINAIKAWRDTLENPKNVHKKCKNEIKNNLVHWLESFGMIHTRHSIWPTSKQMLNPDYIPHPLPYQAGNYLQPLTCNNLANLYGFICLTFGHMLISNYMIYSSIDELNEHLNYGSDITNLSPSLKHSLSLAAGTVEDDDVDDNEAFDRFAKKQMGDPIGIKNNDDDDNNNNENVVRDPTAQGELFKTILIGGVDISKEHCVLMSAMGRITLRTVLKESGSPSLVTRNGETINGVCELNDHDIISFGVGQYFLLRKITSANDKDEEDEEEEEDEDSLDELDEEDEEDMELIKRKKLSREQKKAISLHKIEKNPDRGLTTWESSIRKIFVQSLVDQFRLIMIDWRHQEHLTCDRPLNIIAKNYIKDEIPDTYVIEKEEAFDTFMDYFSPLLQARLSELSLYARSCTIMSIEMKRDTMMRLTMKQVSHDEYLRLERFSGTLCFKLPDNFSYKHHNDKNNENDFNIGNKSINNNNNSNNDDNNNNDDNLNNYENKSAKKVKELFFCATINCKVMDGDEESSLWLWGRHVFLERLYQQYRMFEYYSLCVKESITQSKQEALHALDDIYSVQEDPFLDMPGEELVGVSYLYLDAVQYLMDIDEILPVINYKGRTAGALQVNVRSWIDEVTVEPQYVTADNEVDMETYFNHICHLRLHIGSLSGISPSLSCKAHCEFKFFFHSKKYKTPEHYGFANNPYINQTISIHQKITPDFLDYIQNGSIEIEVWARRTSPLAMEGVHYPDSRLNCKRVWLAEPVYIDIPESDDEDEVNNANNINDDGDDDDDEETEDVFKLQESVRNLKAELEKSKRMLNHSLKSSEVYEKRNAELEREGKGGGMLGGMSSRFSMRGKSNKIVDMEFDEDGNIKKKKSRCVIM